MNPHLWEAITQLTQSASERTGIPMSEPKGHLLHKTPQLPQNLSSCGSWIKVAKCNQDFEYPEVSPPPNAQSGQVNVGFHYTQKSHRHSLDQSGQVDSDNRKVIML